MPEIKVDSDKCILCQSCVNVCPMGVYKVENKRIVPAEENLCIACHACEASCPVEAITVIEKG